MDYENEITTLAAETIALQILISHVFDELARADPHLDFAIRKGFDNAANDTEDLAIKFGKSAPPEHTVKALSVIEELRTMTFGDREKPKRTV